MPCRCRTSRAGGRKAGSRSCCGYVGCYISGAQAPPRRTGAGNGLLPSHAGAWAKEAFGRRQRLRSFRRGRRTSPASPRRVYGRPHHGFRHPQHCPPLSLLRGDGASPQAQRPGLYPGIWDGKDAYLARHLQFLSEKDIACRRQAFRRSRCLCLPRQEHHRIPLGGCLER